MSCEEKSVLLEKYQRQVRAYSDAVINMRAHSASLPQVEFQLLWDLANGAYQLCEETQRRLQQHVVEHGC
jgi:hypothetical protein